MPPAPLVHLRPEGLYCPAGDFYVDPWKPVPRSVITHAHGDHIQGAAGSYVTSQPSVRLLDIRLGADIQVEGLPYGAAKQMGEAKVSLHPAGHILGSSQVRIQVGEETWVVSGDYKRNHDPTCAPFEVVPCDVFITEATFAAPIYRWESGAAIAQEILDWWRHCAAEGSTAVLFCYALGKTQRILAELHALIGDGPESLKPVLIHGALDTLTTAYRDAGVRMLATAKLGDADPKEPLGGRLVMAPPSAYRSPWMRRFKAFETGFASGWVRVRGALRQRGHDRGFVLSDHADWPDLVRTVKETGAKKVLVTHGRTDLLVRYLADEGIDAEALKTAFGGDGEDD